LDEGKVLARQDLERFINSNLFKSLIRKATKDNSFTDKSIINNKPVTFIGGEGYRGVVKGGTGRWMERTLTRASYQILGGDRSDT
jgi:hypothetical protein